jgi:hypothetical protein
MAQYEETTLRSDAINEDVPITLHRFLRVEFVFVYLLYKSNYVFLI